VKFEAGHQPVDDAEQTHVLELKPGLGYEQALRDLAGFDRVWIIWWFHQNKTWRPLVLPPRGRSQRRGVFATRSPHRPNPLGMTPVRLLKIAGLRLTLGPCDLVDGTPVLDLKPYIPAYDSFPGAAAGWIDAVDEELRQPPRFTVVLSPLAEEQARWLREPWGVDFLERLTELLARDPTPHRTRRIKRVEGDRLTIGCGAWRAVFAVAGETVHVLALEPGYPMKFLTREGYDEVPDREAQMAFLKYWPSASL
jgi:tRNA-Thr(GGU) m(6)t(6)A37 methyltransferase TsaA